ncbi:hypothetical protein Tco_0389734, partial [Tanacetum coccineum]
VLGRPDMVCKILTLMDVSKAILSHTQSFGRLKLLFLEASDMLGKIPTLMDVSKAILSHTQGRIEAFVSDGNMMSCLFGRGGLGGTSETRRDSRVVDSRRYRVGSWNVGSLTRKLLELVDALERQSSQTVRDGVGVILKASLKDKVVHVNRRVGIVMPRILWKNSNGDATEVFRMRVAEGVTTQVEVIYASDADCMWNTLACIIKDAAKETLGVAIGTSKTYAARMKSWWLSEE